MQTVPRECLPEAEKDLHAWRCWQCGKLLAKLRLLPGCAVEVKCKCGALNTAAVDKAVRTT